MFETNVRNVRVFRLDTGPGSVAFRREADLDPRICKSEKIVDRDSYLNPIHDMLVI
jgi:hypothetical protein